MLVLVQGVMHELMCQVFGRDVGTAPPYEEQNMTINPGDYLIADLNGVVVLLKELAAQALPLMGKQVDADSKMAVAIKNGMNFSEASKKFRV